MVAVDALVEVYAQKTMWIWALELPEPEPEPELGLGAQLVQIAELAGLWAGVEWW